MSQETSINEDANIETTIDITPVTLPDHVIHVTYKDTDCTTPLSTDGLIESADIVDGKAIVVNTPSAIIDATGSVIGEDDQAQAQYCMQLFLCAVTATSTPQSSKRKSIEPIELTPSTNNSAG